MIIIIIITFDGTINTKGMFLVLKWLLHWLPKMWWQNQVSSQAFMTDGDTYEKGEQSTCLIHVFDFVWIYKPVQGSQHSHWQNGHLWSQFYGEGGIWKWGLGLIGVQDGEQCKIKRNIITLKYFWMEQMCRQCHFQATVCDSAKRTVNTGEKSKRIPDAEIYWNHHKKIFRSKVWKCRG